MRVSRILKLKYFYGLMRSFDNGKFRAAFKSFKMTLGYRVKINRKYF